MRKDIKKRLEKALITLQEPGGSTIRSIIKVINHDSPVLSLRKVLEALQEGINEGFLCMYNGRFKLKQQLFPSREGGMYENSEPRRRERKKGNTPESYMAEDDSDIDIDQEVVEEEEENDEEGEDDDGNKLIFKMDHSETGDQNVSNTSKEPTDKPPRKKNKKRNPGKSSKKKRRVRSLAKMGSPRKRSGGKSPRKARKQPMDGSNLDCLLLTNSSSSIPEKKPSKPTADRPDLKKQRGPRCTSMKKDVRMPSKVHIPFAAPSMPQKGANFNDLIRRSPDPVNGPLFDDYVVRNPGLGMFDTYC